MSDHASHLPSRRAFLKKGTQATAAAALAASVVPHVHAAENNTIQLALVGCGGRGTGAVANAMCQENGPVKLVAMADVFPERIAASVTGLGRKLADKPGCLDVSEDRKFVGFDAYKKAMDCLNPGDVVILATPPAFRWLHFQYAISKKLNVFLEKPVTVDGPTSKRMLALADESVKQNLKCGVGLMVRHCRGRQALKERLDAGEIGDIISMRSYRIAPLTVGKIKRKPADAPEVMFQVSLFHAFLWASGGCFSDFHIHQIDETCWMKGEWPVKAQTMGGRHYRNDCVDQNFDHYSVEYTFADGTKLHHVGCEIPGVPEHFASYVHGSKGCAIVSTASHMPGKCRTFRGQDFAKEDLIWAYPQPERSPYEFEWIDMIEAIRQDKPYNEVKRGVEASLVASMGRMAGHTGQIITFDAMLNCPHEMAPDLANLTADGPAPVMPDSEGKYPIPQPGLLKNREY